MVIVALGMAKFRVTIPLSISPGMCIFFNLAVYSPPLGTQMPGEFLLPGALHVPQILNFAYKQDTTKLISVQGQTRPGRI